MGHRRHSTRQDASRHPSAFAEGRRLRRDAERRRHDRRLTRRHSPLARRALPWLLLLPFLLTGLLSVVTLVLATTFAIGLTLAAAAPLVLAGGIAFHVVRRKVRARSAGTAPLPGRPASRRRPDVVWGHARDRFHTLAAAYAAHECDAMSVLRLPALSDVTVPSTGRFVDAFAHAQALESDAYPGDDHAAQFVKAVDAAERAWRAAREAAERIRLSGLTPAERSTVERVIKLLTTARDSDHEPERLSAYSRARSELAKLDAAGTVHLPRTARVALDEASRGALPA
ncbi:hypothetical protein [Pseudonocardia abyssalis]|uniref:DUF2786 domain-containing protein n=1 Tax=Pseudonocardia abyssalis TaxID=2792008 RepID=A0ABS6UL79_9PSEU|nr:hypothetical protein [Pseudonocardia abyssalis]MBW0115836.1 hypothetical protein [Pseudonocardia abyssalis]MBW0132701.1 hypothetical protein [Pseudonocardia abyssalis]